MNRHFYFYQSCLFFLTKYRMYVLLPSLPLCCQRSFFAISPSSSHLTSSPALSPLPLGGEVATLRFTQYFHGSLSGLTIRPGRIETQKVISCLQACKEGLDINSLESLAKDIKVRGEGGRVGWLVGEVRL